MRKRRSVPKDRKTKIPKKYLGSTRGAKRSELASVLKRVSKLYKEGKKVPPSLLKRRIELGKSKKRARKKS